ncbi:Abi family protein [Rhodopseudomonas sp. HC1]|uniref:Abi family protein n=1 Tax=Rhodopseudomonas infernalis TaxID=2897386 RepID=UPI001EE84B1C|nr:Abi family protein [Rhodopseudomonas infernalis]MCG6204578.1 Abi family protein [Rhodopseudomonas infernalis]
MVGFSLSGAATLARITFAKPALGLEEQAILLASRGLVFENWADSFDHLQHIGYYRFSGYLHPFKSGLNGGSAYYHPGTTFELVHDRYIFDRKLRMLVLEAVEKIEIAARAAISNSVASRHGPHWYMDKTKFGRPGFYHRHERFDLDAWHADFIADLKRQIGHNQASRRDVFIKHYYNSYDRPELPPCWMTFEVISFGSISQCFKFLKHPEYGDVCRKFGLNHQILSSWLHAISYVRNLCAHHSRLWNRVLTIKLTIPNARRVQFNGQNDRIYSVLLAMQIILQKIWSNNHWAEALGKIIDSHPRIPLTSMGFPEDWKQRKEWRLAP